MAAERIRRFVAGLLMRRTERRLARAEFLLARRGLVDRTTIERHLWLLLRHLSAAQRAEFARYRHFTVRGASGRSYRICYGTIANIHVPASGLEGEHRLCAGPDNLPAPAVMLAQKLMLETREAEFLRVAIKHAPLPRARYTAGHWCWRWIDWEMTG